jgi:hypothetical protein
MSEAENILEECRRRGVRLSLGETFDRLDFDAPAGALTSELRARIVAHKGEIVEALFDLEEMAALMGAPEWIDAETFVRAASHPAVLMLQSLGLCHQIVSVRPYVEESKAA